MTPMEEVWGRPSKAKPDKPEGSPSVLDESLSDVVLSLLIWLFLHAAFFLIAAWLLA